MTTEYTEKTNVARFRRVFHSQWDDGWRDFYVLFNSISVISGRCAGNNERLCATELRLRLGRFRLEAGLESRNARSEGKLNPLSYRGSFS